MNHRGHDGFETLRDSSLVTVVCTGCGASFSYLKPPEQSTPADVGEALARITGGRPSGVSGASGAEGAAPDPKDAPPSRLASPSPPEAPEQEQTAQSNGHAIPGGPPRRRLAPPGPHAPRRQANPRLAEQALVPLREHLTRTIAWAAPRRRAIALTIVAIAGVYVLLSLILSERADSPPTSAAAPELTAEEITQAAVTTPAPASDQPTTPDKGPMADGARPLESFAEGGPDVAERAIAPARFTIAMPPDWQRGSAEDGSTTFTSDDSSGQVTVRTGTRDAMTYGQMTDEAASYIAARVDSGIPVARPLWKRVGNLLCVATASEPSGHTEIAYIGVTPTTRYLVVRSIEPSASALVRLQADGIVGSLTAQ